MRLFIAINFNDNTRARLTALRDELRSHSVRGRFSLPENLHLTLAFIGECSPSITDKIITIMDTVEFAPFKATVERLGTFSRGEKGVPRKAPNFVGKRSNDGASEISRLRGSEQAQSVATWWAGLNKCEPLMNLQHEARYKLAICGFEMDGRKYNPHITLGREVVTEITPWRIEPFGETVTGIDLMKSERTGGKLTYTAIYTKEAKDLAL